MGSVAGVGYSDNIDSFQAGKEATARALTKINNVVPDLVLIYQTGKHNPPQFYKGVTSLLSGATQVMGGFTSGAVGDGKLGYDGTQVIVAALKFNDGTKFNIFKEDGLKEKGEHLVGEALARKIHETKFEGDPGLVFMYDSVKNFYDSGFDMNVGTYIVEGMSKGLGGKWPTSAGVGMIGNAQFNPTWQFFNGEITQQSLMGLAVHGKKFKLFTTILHGMKPASDYHTITKTDKNAILEIDGRPALEAISDIMGPDSDKKWEQYPLYVTLGLNRGEKYDDFDEKNYANRMCMAVDTKRKALIMFEPDLKAGDEVQLMRRTIEFSYIREKINALYEEIGDRKPFFGYYIDCVCRLAAYYGSEEEEGRVVQEMIEPRMPFLGMFTGVEIGAVKGGMQALDFTGVLCVFTEE